MDTNDFIRAMDRINSALAGNDVELCIKLIDQIMNKFDPHKLTKISI